MIQQACKSGRRQGFLVGMGRRAGACTWRRGVVACNAGQPKVGRRLPDVCVLQTESARASRLGGGVTLASREHGFSRVVGVVAVRVACSDPMYRRPVRSYTRARSIPGAAPVSGRRGIKSVGGCAAAVCLVLVNRVESVAPRGCGVGAPLFDVRLNVVALVIAPTMNRVVGVCRRRTA